MGSVPPINCARTPGSAAVVTRESPPKNTNNIRMMSCINISWSDRARALRNLSSRSAHGRPATTRPARRHSSRLEDRSTLASLLEVGGCGNWEIELDRGARESDEWSCKETSRWHGPRSRPRRRRRPDSRFEIKDDTELGLRSWSPSLATGTAQAAIRPSGWGGASTRRAKSPAATCADGCATPSAARRPPAPNATRSQKELSKATRKSQSCGIGLEPQCLGQRPRHIASHRDHLQQSVPFRLPRLGDVPHLAFLETCP